MIVWLTIENPLMDVKLRPEPGPTAAPFELPGPGPYSVCELMLPLASGDDGFLKLVTLMPAGRRALLLRGVSRF
jgi:hypothetical protein